MLKNVDEFTYLRRKITSDDKNEMDVVSRVNLARAAFTKKRKIFFMFTEDIVSVHRNNG